MLVNKSRLFACLRVCVCLWVGRGVNHAGPLRSFHREMGRDFEDRIPAAVSSSFVSPSLVVPHRRGGPGLLATSVHFFNACTPTVIEELIAIVFTEGCLNAEVPEAFAGVLLHGEVRGTVEERATPRPSSR